MTDRQYGQRFLDSYPRKCPECKGSIDDGHYLAEVGVCWYAEQAREAAYDEEVHHYRMREFYAQNPHEG